MRQQASDSLSKSKDHGVLFTLGDFCLLAILTVQRFQHFIPITWNLKQATPSKMIKVHFHFSMKGVSHQIIVPPTCWAKRRDASILLPHQFTWMGIHLHNKV